MLIFNYQLSLQPQTNPQLNRKRIRLIIILAEFNFSKIFISIVRKFFCVISGTSAEVPFFSSPSQNLLFIALEMSLINQMSSEYFNGNSPSTKDRALIKSNIEKMLNQLFVNESLRRDKGFIQ